MNDHLYPATSFIDESAVAGYLHSFVNRMNRGITGLDE